MQDSSRRQIFDEWMRSHRALLSRIVRAYAFGEHDREDLFQEIAFQLWNSIPRFQAQSSVTTWIYRVALYSGMAWSKRERTHNELRDASEVAQVVAIEAPSDEDPRLDWLYREIARLDVVDRSLTLLLLEGLAYREIGETLGISENHVGVKLNRIKKLLVSRSDGVKQAPNQEPKGSSGLEAKHGF